MPLTFLEIPDSLGWAFVFSKLNVAVTFGSFKWLRLTLVPLEAFCKSLNTCFVSSGTALSNHVYFSGIILMI